ncbi:cytochrome c5 [Chryseobacterium defluvii]|uniref:Cytochrome c5 n=1 Tax=Chryseobacterium defluvii TaxID=160396 RepID=A0A840KFJ5_9FLAO|nr:cytochrome C [Chryseobacterium defluvii]MBB4807966.1 cytochrome c5 [Chryseobacterium defluvii]
MKKFIAVASFTAVLLASCTPKATTPTASAGPAVSTAEQLAQGKTIFENSCGKCHELPKPTAYTSVQWVGIMNSMAPKAKLTEEQHQWVYDYVVSVKK